MPMPMSTRGVLHAPHILSKQQFAALQHWLPVLGAEALILGAFLIWIWHRGVALHGLAVVYAWTIYGLIALGLFFLWIGPPTGKGAGRP
jgi:hypothetical protein